MESSIGAAEKQNKATKRLIPWHCQQRYQTTLSQRSINYSIRTNSYKKKIKSLLDNNKTLARALERCKDDKENMAEKNNQNMDIIDISRIKLKEISENLKKVAASVDETFDLLQSQVEPNSVKSFQGYIMPRTTFKKTLKAASNLKALAEVPEVLEVEQNLNDNKTLNLSIKQVPLRDKPKSKAKETFSKAVDTEKDNLTVPKTKKQCLKAKNSIISKTVAVRTSKPSVDDTPPSYLLGISSDSESFRNLIEQSKKASETKTLKKTVPNKKKHEPKHKLRQYSGNPILNLGFLPDSLMETCDTVSASKVKVGKISGDKALSNNKIRNSASTKNVKITPPQIKSQNSFKDSWSTTDESTIENTKKPLIEVNHEILKIPRASSKPDFLDTKAAKAIPDVLDANFTLGNPKVYLERNDFMQNSTLIKNRTVSLREIFHEPQVIPKLTIKLKSNKKNDKVSYKKVGFLLEEDSDKIEMLNEAVDPVTELKISTKSKTQKRPLKENAQNIAAPPSKKQARSTLVPQALGEKEKNTFLVTAEIHEPPDGYVPDDAPFEDKTCFFKMQPSVVLTDIFGSTGQKNRILENVCYNTNKVIGRYPRIDEENSDEQSSKSNTSDSFNVQCNKEK